MLTTNPHEHPQQQLQHQPYDDAATPASQQPAAAVPYPTQAFHAPRPNQESYHHSSLASMNLDATVDFTWENLNYDVE
ncbi:Hypothetical protein, putative, partial [Bodo saltans]